MKALALRLSLCIPIGILCGLASALFLFLLDLATTTRLQHPLLFLFLPLAGFTVGMLYSKLGIKGEVRVERGTNLLLDEFHDPKAVVPFRLAPLVLVGTILTHLVGGSAGREGTAVQIGASIADRFSKRVQLQTETRKSLLMIGISAGFGSVFGVPFAGAIFGLEVFSVGKLHWRSILECFIGAVIAHLVTLACGIVHTPYPLIPPQAISFGSLASALTAGILFGLAARLFVIVNETIKTAGEKLCSALPVRAGVGGAILAALYFAFPSLTRFAGLGVPVILESLHAEVPQTDWLAKLALTALTLGAGFKGGEVTPLLFIGSTLGNALAPFSALSLPMMAAIGLVSVFAGAANTPLACSVMAIELFGWDVTTYALIACGAAYFSSGHHGIYSSQRIYRRKNLKLNSPP